jgi:hypothetical protein
MDICITGGTGFVGSRLCRSLLADGHRVTTFGSTPKESLSHPLSAQDRFTYIAADTTQPGDWQKALESADAVVNLAGRTIFHYWTESYKKSIYQSRIQTTQNLVSALPKGREIPVISASAAGFYGDRGETVLTEETSGGDDFLAVVCRDWESAAKAAEKNGARVVITRFGIVLGKGGGALSKMIPFFKFGLGGPLGDGEQWFPWIHRSDLVAAIRFALENDSLSGSYNYCSPHPVRNRDFVKTLGKVLHRPAVIPAPKFLVRTVAGELGNAITFSQRAVGEKLQNEGFRFEYPELEPALRAILS